jgi:hypothetical protein
MGKVRFTTLGGSAQWCSKFILLEDGTPTDTTPRLGFTVEKLAGATEKLQAPTLSGFLGESFFVHPPKRFRDSSTSAAEN